MEAFQAQGRALQEFETLKLQESNVQPIRPREGMMAFADGVNWDPGSGKGFYVYTNGAWVKSGGGGGGITQNPQSSDYTLISSDNGKFIYHPTTDNNPRTWDIPGASFSVGAAITFVNRINVITITNSETMVFTPTGVTGSRSLAAEGLATVLKVDTGVWFIAGNGLT